MLYKGKITSVVGTSSSGKTVQMIINAIDKVNRGKKCIIIANYEEVNFYLNDFFNLDLKELNGLEIIEKSKTGNSLDIIYNYIINNNIDFFFIDDLIFLQFFLLFENPPKKKNIIEKKYNLNEYYFDNIVNKTYYFEEIMNFLCSLKDKNIGIYLNMQYGENQKYAIYFDYSFISLGLSRKEHINSIYYSVKNRVLKDRDSIIVKNSYGEFHSYYKSFKNYQEKFFY